jgi:hypothetical protein
VPSLDRGPDYSDYEDEDGTIQEKIKDVDSSDYNLAMQLELARQNSLNQHVKPTLSLDVPVEDTIYEGQRSFVITVANADSILNPFQKTHQHPYVYLLCTPQAVDQPHLDLTP